MAPATPAIDVKSLHAKIRELMMEIFYWERSPRRDCRAQSDDRP